MSGDVVPYDAEGQSGIRPYYPDPEPEPTVEQEHASEQARDVDDRLILAAPFVRYQADGGITGFGEMAYGLIMSERIQSGGILVGVGKPDSHYVDRFDLVVREKAPCTATLDGMILSGLPVPCVVRIGLATTEPTAQVPVSYDVDTASIELEFDHPGEWEVAIQSAPYLTATFKVTANV